MQALPSAWHIHWLYKTFELCTPELYFCTMGTCSMHSLVFLLKPRGQKRVSVLQLWLPGSHLPLAVVVSQELKFRNRRHTPSGSCLHLTKGPGEKLTPIYLFTGKKKYLTPDFGNKQQDSVFREQNSYSRWDSRGLGKEEKALGTLNFFNNTIELLCPMKGKSTLQALSTLQPEWATNKCHGERKTLSWRQNVFRMTQFSFEKTIELESWAAKGNKRIWKAGKSNSHWIVCCLIF